MKKVLMYATSIILFIELLDTTILYACFVPIANDFGISASRMSLAVISYIVGTCLFIPIVSWLSYQFNKINIIIITLIAFSIFSLVCSLSPDLYTFSLFRFLQGVAISIAGAMSIIVLLSICNNQEIVKVMGVINIPALLGTALGPFVGAIFSYYLSWRIAFFINFPLCLMIALSLRQLKSNPLFHLKPNTPIIRLDWLGFMLLSLFLILTSTGFEQMSQAIKPPHFFLILSGIVLCILYVMIWKTRQHTLSKNNHSILDLDVFSNINFSLGIIINIIARAAMCGVPVLLSVFLQQLYGFSVMKAGFYLAIIAGGGIIAKFFSSHIEIIGVHRTIILSSILTSFSIASLSQHEWWVTNNCLFIICFLFGFIMSLLYTAMNSVMYITLKKNEIPNASNIGSIIQQLGIGLGVVIAVGGFQLLASQYNMMSSIENSQTTAFQQICYFLAALMMLNPIVAISFQLFYKRNLLNKETIALDQRYE